MAVQPDPTRSPADQLELLAPAGDFAALEAALEAGASAVYFGLTTLNARRRAKNFSQDEFARAVEAAHARGARAYLALNIDLAQRELGQAARILELARQSKVDAVLLRDPALLALKPFFPELEFHFSTQTCITNSADVEAAKSLGAKRVVLAREMSLGEIAAASAVPGIQTEVFVQGALCFCMSGRCLLSSWVGGRSGNRGACTSPCRVPWTIDDRPAGTPLSMRDLSALARIEDLRKAGVSSLKIEGRLKSATWVRQAVDLYRRALNHADLAQLLLEASDLGAYTGRTFTTGYLDAHREDLTALAAGRAAASPAPATPAEETADAPQQAAAEEDESAEDESSPAFDFHIEIADGGIVCQLQCNGRTSQWTLPRSVVHRPEKAISVGQFLTYLRMQTLRGCRAGKITSNDENYLFVPRATNALPERISSTLRQLLKEPEIDQVIRIELPPQVQQVLAPAAAHAANDLCLGDRPDRARLAPGDICSFVKRVRASGDVSVRPEAIIVEGLSANGMAKAVAAAGGIPLVVALPSVFFEADLSAVSQLIAAASAANLAVEANSWGGWRLARSMAAAQFEAGPGLAVLNSLAARKLAELGFQCVALSLEADRKQLEELTAHCPCPCSMILFARPALMLTRAQLPKDKMLGRSFTDRRDTRLLASVERGLWTFRPPQPFDLRATRNHNIRAHHLVMDLVSSPDPAGEWLAAPDREAKTFRFNYGRTLA